MIGDFPTPRLARARRAMTLVELLVGMVVMLTILGLAFGISTETSRATRKITRRQHAMDYCQRALTQITEHLGSAVAPQQLTGLANRDAIKPRFESDTISVPTYNHRLSEFLRMTTFSVEENKEAEVSYLQLSVDPVVETVGSQSVAQKVVESVTGITPDEFSVVVAFGYAEAASPGHPPRYQDSWPADQWPDLIQVKLMATLKQDSAQPIELQTAVIPGVLLGRAPEPAPEPELVPAPEQAPAANPAPNPPAAQTPADQPSAPAAPQDQTPGEGA